uniref:Putative portal protein n=1 Tax=viral metagenome TaxID=1070528 RepID=A0A6H1ZYE5_9ZZZZ
MLDTVLKAGKIPFTLEPSPYEESQEGEYFRERDARIERMKDKINEQLTMRNADREYMKKWLSGAYYGMAFSKFDVEPVVSTEFKQVDMGLGNTGQYLSPEEQSQYVRYEMVQAEEDVPGHRYVSVWNMVWDLDADDLQSGDGYAERIMSSAWDLRQLVKKPGYIKDNIVSVIQEKIGDTSTDTGDAPAEHPSKESIQDRRKKFRRYEFYLRAPKKYVDEFEVKLKNKGDEIPYIGLIGEDEEAEESGIEIEIMGEICDGEIIRYIRNSGKRPHKMWVIESNLDESTGTGIADNMEGVQGALVGMIRAFEDNKKLSANVTTAVKKRYFNDPNQLDEIKPGTQYDLADSVDDVRKAILPIVFPDVGESLMSGIELMLRLKDDVSMIPTIMQGFTLDKHQPDTAYELRQLTANAGKYIGQAIRNNDEQFIEPEIRDIYEYNMVYGDDESCKVNAKVKANGFTSFQNKEIRGERMKLLLGGLVANEFLNKYVKVKPHLDVIYESMDEDPDKFIKTEEEMMNEAKQEAQMRAGAEQRAIEIMRAEKEHEARLEAGQQTLEHAQEIEAKDREHEQTITETEQEHINDMEMATLEAKLDRVYKIDSRGGTK